jgi:hypothetical protein
MKQVIGPTIFSPIGIDTFFTVQCVRHDHLE